MRSAFARTAENATGCARRVADTATHRHAAAEPAAVIKTIAVRTWNIGALAVSVIDYDAVFIDALLMAAAFESCRGGEQEYEVDGVRAFHRSTENRRRDESRRGTQECVRHKVIVWPR